MREEHAFLGDKGFGSYEQRHGVNGSIHQQELSRQLKSEEKLSPRETLRAKAPRIEKIIALLWGTQHMQDQFTKWLLTDVKRPDGTPRKGFPHDVQRALMELSNSHAEQFNFSGTPHFDWPPDTWEE
jgi:hypothetical protein